VKDTAFHPLRARFSVVICCRKKRAFHFKRGASQRRRRLVQLACILLAVASRPVRQAAGVIGGLGHPRTGLSRTGLCCLGPASSASTCRAACRQSSQLIRPVLVLAGHAADANSRSSASSSSIGLKRHWCRIGGGPRPPSRPSSSTIARDTRPFGASSAPSALWADAGQPAQGVAQLGLWRRLSHHLA